MPITNYYGLGKVRSSQLIKLGINTIGDFAACESIDPQIKKIFLNQTQKFIDNANGFGDDIVKLDNNILSSISKEKTFINGPAEESREVYLSLKQIAERVSERLIERNICGSNVSISIKTREGHKSRSMQLDKLINSSDDIYLYASQLMNKF
jgi:nucleotidyltransferase/DNA polymerase involved in DNA repair